MTERSPCPTCGRMKPDFAIRNGRCRDDRMDEERTEKAQAFAEKRLQSISARQKER